MGAVTGKVGYPFAYSLCQFFGLRAEASNLCFCYDSNSQYTIDMFIEDFPQFTIKDDTTEPPTYTPIIPENILKLFISMANSSVGACRWGEFWRYAIGLFVAHYVSLYLMTYKDGVKDSNDVDTGGSIINVVKSAQLGDASITFDSSAVTSATANWGAWNATPYGQQLVTMARYASLGGMYVI